MVIQSAACLKLAIVDITSFHSAKIPVVVKNIFSQVLLLDFVCNLMYNDGCKYLIYFLMGSGVQLQLPTDDQAASQWPSKQPVEPWIHVCYSTVHVTTKFLHNEMQTF